MAPSAGWPSTGRLPPQRGSLHRAAPSTGPRARLSCSCPGALSLECRSLRLRACFVFEQC
eukprot:11876762-Alexandrium_andersonii.AAC.1